MEGERVVDVGSVDETLHITAFGGEILDFLLLLKYLLVRIT